MSNQSVAELAEEDERGDGEVIKSNQGKRTKAEQNINTGVTPVITKLRQTRTEFKVFSPSDQLFSPCTRKIEKSRLAGKNLGKIPKDNAEQSTAELADEYERGDGEVIKSNQGKRTKAEQVEHKHGHPEGDTRRIVDNAVKGEEKRKEKERERTASQSSK